MSALINPLHAPIGRGAWWLSQLYISIFGFILLFLYILSLVSQISDAGNVPGAGKLPIFIIYVTLAYMNLCSCLNRLRDSGRNGLWYLTFFLPFVGMILMIYFCGIEASNAVSHSPGKPDCMDFNDAGEWSQSPTDAAPAMPAPAMAAPGAGHMPSRPSSHIYAHRPGHSVRQGRAYAGANGRKSFGRRGLK